MFVLMTAWTQSATAGYVAADQDGSIAGLATIGFALVFVGWILFAGIREALRMRREDRLADAGDIYTIPVDGLGPTMADGGEPIARETRARLRRIR
jgi:hypothetical protein